MIGEAAEESRDQCCTQAAARRRDHQRRQTKREDALDQGKRNYSLDLIMARLSKAAENSISMAFVVMCVKKIWRLLPLFLSLFLPSYAPGNGQTTSQWCLGTVGILKHKNHWVLEKVRFAAYGLLSCFSLRSAFQEHLKNYYAENQGITIK